MYYKIKSIIENSEHTIVLSEELKNNALKLVKDENKIVQINNACDGVLFYDQKKDRGDKLKLLFVGRLVSQKGVRRLLKIAQMLDCKTDFRLRIVGDGPKRSRMESFVRKNNLSNKIVFLGNIPQVDLVNLYNESHFLLAPSLSEGMSLFIESIFCSTPVLTTKVSGMMEVIDEKPVWENFSKIIKNVITIS